MDAAVGRLRFVFFFFIYGAVNGVLRQALPGHHVLQHGDVRRNIQGFGTEQSVQLPLKGGDNGAHDALHPLHGAADIAADTIRRARLVIAYTKNTNDAFRARQILIDQLVAAGRYTEAMEEAEKYPERVDFTANYHKAFIGMASGNPNDALRAIGTEIDYSLQAFEMDTVLLAKAYYATGRFEDAVTVYERYFAAMDVLFDGNPVPYYDFDSGDCYLLLAQTYLALEKRERAMDCVEKAIDSCIARMAPDREHISPFLRHSALGWAYAPLSRETVRMKCMEKLSSPEIAPLIGETRYTALQDRIESL